MTEGTFDAPAPGPLGSDPTRTSPSSESPPPDLRRNAIASIAGRLGSVLLWVLVTPYALRKLGQERFGIWSLFFVLSGYVLTLDLGMWATVSRFVSMASARGQRRALRRVLVRGLTLSITLGALWASVFILGRDVFLRLFHVPVVWQAEAGASLMVFSLSLVVLSISLVLQGALTGLQRLDLWNAFFMAGLATNATVLIVGLSRGMGLMAAALAAVFGHLVSSSLAAIALRVLLRRSARLESSDSEEGPTWRELLGYGVVVQAANGLGLAQFQAPKLMLGIVGRLAWVTHFELAFRVANSLWSLPTLAQMSVIPAAAHASATRDAGRARELYAWCCRWVFAATAWTMGGLWLLAPQLFRVWLGPGNEEAALTARWLAVGFAISTLAGPATSVARGYGWPWLEAINFAIALAINVALGLLLIPRLGPQGAAIAMATSFVVAGFVMVTMFHRRLGVASGDWLMRWVLPRYAPAVAVVAALAFVMTMVHTDTRAASAVVIVVGGGIFTLLYALATWRTGDPGTMWVHGRAILARFTRRAPIAPDRG